MRHPNEWPDAQRVFELAYRSDPGGFDRRPVLVRWREANRGRVGLPIDRLWALSTVINVVAESATGWPDGRNAAIWAPDGPRRAPAELVIPVRSLPSDRGESDGVLVGEHGLNAACCIELADGTVLWPSHNPGVPSQRPRRSKR